MDDIEYRPATHEDYEDVVAFTEDTWTDLDVEASDYIPDVYHDWIDGDRQRTVVADAGDAIAGIAQVVLLSAYEAWAQGMRVNPAFRGEGVAMGINDDLFAWAREQGATVARNMVFSWNQAGLGQSRANGFEPVTEFRWLHPEPDESGAVESDASGAVEPDASGAVEPDASGAVEPDASGAVESADPDAAWSFWTDSDAREHLGGLGLDMDETWALRELTRELFARAAAETALLTAGDEDGTHGVSYRTRTVERESDDGETETWAEYGVAAWEDVAAGEQLLAAISADAATCGADRTRVLIPETAQYVTDGAYLRAKISEEPDFVLAADLTGTR